MKLIKLITSLGLIFILSSCSLSEALDTLMDDEITEYSDNVVSIIINKNIEELIPYLHDDVMQNATPSDIENLLKIIPNEKFISEELTNYNFTSKASIESGTSTIHNIEVQYQFSDKWLVLSLQVVQEDDEYKVYGIYLTPLENNLKEINKVDISKATPIEFLILAFMIIFPIFVACTFIVAFKMRKKLVKKKRWLFFILICWGSISYNWTTKFLAINPLTFGLFGAGFSAPGLYGPMTLSLYFPIGAALFWFFKKRGTLSLNISDKDKDDPITPPLQ